MPSAKEETAAATTTAAASPTIWPRTRKKVWPLEIPGLLFKISSFVDPHTLAHAVILVCRRWFLMNQPSVLDNRGVHFNGIDPSSVLDEALQELPWATWTKWFMEYPSQYQKQ